MPNPPEETAEELVYQSVLEEIRPRREPQTVVVKTMIPWTDSQFCMLSPEETQAR